MPHYKCLPCKTRLYSAASPTDLVGDLCPECGSPLEPVGELAEVVGFRSIKSPDSTPAGGTPSTHQLIADPVDDFIARREATVAQVRLDLERWVDQQVADRVGPFIARREAILAEARLDLERWVDQQVADRVGPFIARREAISGALTG
jgi:hypothetical protein